MLDAYHLPGYGLGHSQGYPHGVRASIKESQVAGAYAQRTWRRIETSPIVD